LFFKEIFMDPPHDATRRRTFYNPDPDYSRPLFQLPAKRRERLLSRLKFLYGEAQAAACLPELERILRVHCAHKPPEMLAKEKRYNPAERFSERDMILITYGDIIHGDGRTPLAALRRFVDKYNRGAINTIHLLPFFPYSSDRGFSVVDFSHVDPKLGTWEDIRKTKQRYDLMFDAVLNQLVRFIKRHKAAEAPKRKLARIPAFKFKTPMGVVETAGGNDKWFGKENSRYPG
jgi:sucrose phosphorylase